MKHRKVIFTLALFLTFIIFLYLIINGFKTPLETVFAKDLRNIHAIRYNVRDNITPLNRACC